jgi:hypothetical protein
MLKNFDAWKDLTIDFELDAHQRAVLAGTIGQEWFDIVQKIFEDEVRKFQLLLANTPAWEEDKVFARHALAQAAGMIYKGVFTRIAEQAGIQKIIELGVGTVHNPEQPPTMEEFQDIPPDTFDTI